MPSENSVMANFGEFPFRDCPKRVGGACGVTLRSTSTVLFDPFWPPCASQIHAHSVALTPFRTVSPRTRANRLPWHRPLARIHGRFIFVCPYVSMGQVVEQE